MSVADFATIVSLLLGISAAGFVWGKMEQAADQLFEEMTQ